MWDLAGFTTITQNPDVQHDKGVSTFKIAKVFYKSMKQYPWDKLSLQCLSMMDLNMQCSLQYIRLTQKTCTFVFVVDFYLKHHLKRIDRCWAIHLIFYIFLLIKA